MNIRKLVENDVQQYFKLRLESLKDHPEAFASSYEEEKEHPIELYKNRLSSQDSITFGAFNDEKLVGIITIVKQNKLKLKHRIELVSAYVIPEERGNHIGKKLVSQALREVEKLKGIEQVYLTVESKNNAAKSLYQSAGFELIGTDKKALRYADSYFDVDHMVLYL